MAIAGSDGVMTRVWFFKGAKALGYHRGTDRVDTGPSPLADLFPTLAAQGFNSPDAAVNLGNGKVYFFKGSEYVRWDIRTGKLDLLRIPIAKEWIGFDKCKLPNGKTFADGIDAALNWWNGKVYFFRGAHYIRYDLKKNQVDLKMGVVPIAKEWNGFSEARAAGGKTFADGVDAAIDWGDGKVYFFRDDAYLRYDKFDDHVDEGWPKKIGRDHVTRKENWPGLRKARFATKVKAAVDLFPGGEIFLDDADRMETNQPQGPAFIDRPWRGVLHTTEGNNVNDAIGTFRKKNVWPHFTIDPATDRIVQHYTLSRGARALKNPQGVHTNDARAIQIEIVGRAARAGDLTADQLAFVRRVMLLIEEKVPIARRSGLTFVGSPAQTKKVRLKDKKEGSEWARFAGWCGHQHVPGNDHWDPGAIDVATLVAPNR